MDTSVLMAIVLDEPEAPRCREALVDADVVVISAGTMAEALIVSAGRGMAAELIAAVEKIELQIVDVTSATAEQIGDAYRHWGKGIHPAGLNFGDCFAYVVAKENGCPLLYLGNDFAKTDIESVL